MRDEIRDETQGAMAHRARAGAGHVVPGRRAAAQPRRGRRVPRARQPAQPPASARLLPARQCCRMRTAATSSSTSKHSFALIEPFDSAAAV